jgi:hypothetical protein
MNKGQQMFHDFYMGLVLEGKEDEAEKLLQEGFIKQDEGNFDAKYLNTVSSKYFALIRPECTQQLKQAMSNFSSHI